MRRASWEVQRPARGRSSFTPPALRIRHTTTQSQIAQLVRRYTASAPNAISKMRLHGVTMRDFRPAAVACIIKHVAVCTLSCIQTFELLEAPYFWFGSLTTEVLKT